MKIDTTTDYGKRVEQRLKDEQIIWMTTVDSVGRPQPAPVWFLWDGKEVLIYSQPNTHKLRNIGRSSRIALNFNSTETGGDVVVFAADAVVDNELSGAVDNPKFIAKYENGIEGLGMTAQSFSDSYSVPIRVTLTKVRGF